MTQSLFRRLSYFTLLFAVAVDCVADDWPHWRGIQRTGVIRESSGWNGTQWIANKPDWSVNVGEGASSPLVIGQQVFTLGNRDGTDLVSCLDARTGRASWTVSYSAPLYARNAMGDEGLYSGPSSTPEFDPATQKLYTLSADGDLHCWDTRRGGEKIWHRNLYDDYQMPQRAKVGRSQRRDYGYTSAPFVQDSWVLVEVGAPNGSIIAFDKQSGKEVWRSQSTSVAGHTGGMAPLIVERIPCIAAFTFDGLLVVRLDQGHVGETVATYPWVTDFANNIASPATQDDCVLITSSYNHQAICKLRIGLGGATKLWEQPVASKTCTPIIHDGHIYIGWDRLRVLNWETGKLEWEGPSLGDAGSCIVTSDDKLIVWANKGDLILAETAKPEKPGYRELARVSRLARTDVWPHVVLANRQLFCRDRDGNLMSFSVAE